MVDESAKSGEETAASSDNSSLVVVDIGKKQRKKRIRDLRKGRGKLFERVCDLLEDMKGEGTIGPNAQPVVIVVRQKDRSQFPFRMKK